MTQRNELSVFVRANGKVLFGPRALTGGIKHLRAREREFDWPLNEAGRCRRQQGVAPLKTF